MSFRRIASPKTFASGDALTPALVGIGFNLGGEGVPANIEDTLVAASIEGMERDDLRVLSLLADWLEIHLQRVNAARLVTLLKSVDFQRTRTFWAAVARWTGDVRLKPLRRFAHGPVDLLRTGNEFQLSRRGPDHRFAHTPLRAPQGVLRSRPADVLTPIELARRHPVYRERVRMGANYRADTWAELTQHPKLGAAELARRTYASFATAWQARRDFQLIDQLPQG